MKEQDNTIEKLMTIEKLINELVEMRHQIIELKDSETQRRMAVEALRVSENKYRTLLENIPHKLFLKDINSAYLSCNEQYARDLKIKPDEISGKTDFDFFPREIAEKSLSDDKRIMNSGRGEEIEERYTPAGEGAFIRTVKTPIKDEKGNVTGILGFFWDITGQKQTEEELKKNLQSLEEQVLKGKIELQINNEQNQKETAERKRLEEELRGSEVKWRTAEAKITERMAELRTVQEQLQREIRERKKLEEDFRGLEVKCRAAEAKIAERSAELEAIQEQLQKETNVRQRTEEQLHTAEEKCRTLETKITERTAELQTVQEQLQMETNVRQRTEEQLHTAEEKRRTLETKITERTAELQTVQEQLQMETNARQRTEEQLHTAEEKRRVVETKVTELTSELQMFQEELQKETTERQRMEEQLWGMEEKVRVVEAQVAKRTVDVEKVKEELHKEVVDHKLAKEALQKNEEATKKLVKENAIMEEIGRIINSALNVEEVYERFSEFAEEVCTLIRFDRVTITVINPEDNTLTLSYFPGQEIAGRKAGEVLPLVGTSAEAVMRTRSSLLIQKEKQEEIIGQFPDLLPFFEAGFQTMILVPLISKNQVIGVLNFLSTQSNSYTEGDLRISEKVGSQIAGTIADARRFLEQKRVEESLRISEQKYRLGIENSPLGIWVSSGGTLTFINPKGLEILGYSREELTSKSLTDLLHPDDQKMVMENYAGWEKGTGSPHTFTSRFVRKDGGIKWLESKGALIQWEGSPAIINFITDVTDRKRAEDALRQSVEPFRTLAKAMEEILFILDKG